MTGCNCNNINFKPIDSFASREPAAGEEESVNFSIAGNGQLWQFQGRMARRDVSLNKVKIWLAFPITIIDNSPAIRNEDWMFSLTPLINNVPHNVKTVILDPGHGGEHPGAKGQFSIEKELNRKIADLTGEILRQKGYTVLFTRADDETVELDARAQAGCFADIFVSIHCNAAPNNKAEGIETFAITPKGAYNSNDSDHSIPVDINDDAPGYNHCAESFALAYAIQKNLIRNTGATDRGAKRARFHVLYFNPAPAVLVECGFLSNPQEEKLLNDSAYQMKIAQAIANGIDSYKEGAL